MLTKLIASRPPRSGKRFFTAGTLSLSAHTVGILAAVFVTAHAGAPRRAALVDTTMVFLSRPSRDRAEEEKPEPREVIRVDVPLRGFQSIVALSEIPTELPPVDFGERFDPRDYSGRGVEGGVGTGFEAPPNVDVVYAERVVHEQPERLAGPLPKYPPLMKLAGIEGTVVIEFVIDTLGHVESRSHRVISSPNPAFLEPVMEAVAHTVFRPGRVNGRAVRVLVRMPFNFVIAKNGQ